MENTGGVQESGTIRSFSVMVSANQPAKPERRYVSFRDVRQHRKVDLQHKLEAFDWSLIDSCANLDEATKLKAFDWSLIDSCANLDEATNLLGDSLKRMHDESCPLIKIKVSSRDPPYMTPIIKYLCRKRISTSRKDMNTIYRNALTILSARIKRNLFARRTENMKLNQRNGGTLYITSWEENAAARMSVPS